MDRGRNHAVNQYEIVYIFDSALSEEQVAGKLERYHALVAGENGGEITAVDHWGRRQLAYPIQRKTAGYYVVAQFSTLPANLPELERFLKLDDELLRYLIVLHEGEPTQPMSLATRQARSEGGEGEDEDEEE